MKIYKFLHTQVRKVQSTLGDGNCLFRWFSFKLLAKEEDHLEVRSLCIKCEHKEFDFYQEFTNGKEERRSTGMSKRTGSVTGEKVAHSTCMHGVCVVYKVIYQYVFDWFYIDHFYYY